MLLGMNYRNEDFLPKYQPNGELSTEMVKANILKTVEEGYSFFEWKYKRLDGKEFYANILLVCMNFKGKQVLQATVRDISERKRSEEERETLIKKLEISYDETQKVYREVKLAERKLARINRKLEKALDQAEEANRLKSEFLAIMSHELRTPLTGMLGFSQILSLDSTLNEKQLRSVNFINRSGKRLLNVLSDLLEISVIEAGKLKIEYSEISLAKIIEDVYLLFKNDFINKNITFDLELNNLDFVFSVSLRL